MEFAASFSGGKDSTLAIKRMLDRGHRIVAIIVSGKEDKESSWTHNIKREYFKKAAEIFRCELIFTDTNVEDYEEKFEKALSEAKKLGAQACIFGDIDIVEHIKWNNRRCQNIGIECIHPLLFEDRKSIAKEFISTSIKANIVKIDESTLSEDLIGQVYEQSFIDKLEKLQVDPCGENGEFHTKIDLDSLRKVICKEIYIDNASSSFPKAPNLAKSMSEFIDNESFSINRGTYMKAYKLSSKVIDVRDKMLKFTNSPKGYNCVFGSSATELINLILRGVLKEGDEIIVDDRMHNSTWRTLQYLEKKGINIKVWSSSSDNNNRDKLLISKSRKAEIKSFILGSNENLDSKNSGDDLKDLLEYEYKISDFENLIGEKTKVVFLTLVDNITGFYNRKAIEVGKVCARKNIIFFIDAVQAACEREINVEELKAHAIVVSSHIGLMGPEGLAHLIINNEIAKEIDPLIYGGTGSQSNSPSMPLMIPDKFEAGTMNLPAIIGTGAALDFIDYVGLDKIIEKKHILGKKLREGLSKIENVDAKGSGSFCSVIISGQDDAMVAFNLDMINHIMTRVGIQCSPCTHMAEDTFPNGSIRFSIGYFNNKYDIDYIIKSVEENICI